ncbi:MAG TPA: hypothetical protein VKH37_05770 [Ferruginibacter sp.]|nr:hypothetical protein [Ferruginibacter sp.]
MKISNGFPTNATLTNRKRRIALVLILITDVGMLAWGAMAALLPGQLLGPGGTPILEAEYAGFTGSALSALTATSPATTDFITIIFRMYGIFNVVFGLMAVAITITAFRNGERWAWWTLLVGNTIAVGSAIIFDRVMKAIGIFELSEYIGLAIVFIALGLTIPFVRTPQPVQRTELT